MFIIRNLKQRIAFLFVCISSVSLADAPDQQDMIPMGNVALGPTIELQSIGAAVNQNRFGTDRQVFGEHSTSWYEATLGFGVEGAWTVNQSYSFWGKLAGLGVTTGGYDAALSNRDEKYVNRLDLYKFAFGWQSGNLLDFGHNALRIAAGQQNYRLGKGFVIWKGGQDGGNRGGYWIGARSPWLNTATMDLTVNDSLEVNLFYLQPNGNPNQDTHLTGFNADLDLGGGWQFGVLALDVFSSNDALRRDTQDLNLRVSYNDTGDPGFGVDGQYVWQNRGGAKLQKNAGYVEAFWQFGGAFNPRLSYRYASFDNEYDPLFYGSYGWGSWYQGEYLGEYTLTNTNLASHQVKLIFEPADDWTMYAIYYYFRVNTLNEGQFSNPVRPMTDHNLAQEYDLIAQYQVTDDLRLLFQGIITTPLGGATEWTGGDRTISYMLLGLTYDYY